MQATPDISGEPPTHRPVASQVVPKVQGLPSSHGVLGVQAAECTSVGATSSSSSKQMRRTKDRMSPLSSDRQVYCLLT